MGRPDANYIERTHMPKAVGTELERTCRSSARPARRGAEIDLNSREAEMVELSGDFSRRFARRLPMHQSRDNRGREKRPVLARGLYNDLFIAEGKRIQRPGFCNGAPHARGACNSVVEVMP